MTEQDWLDEIFDKPSSELSKEASRKRELLKDVLINRQAMRKDGKSKPLPWNNQQLTQQKEALIGKIFGEDQHTLVDQPKPVTTQPIVKPQQGTLGQLTRNLVPVAMAATVAMFAFILVPTLQRPTLQSLLDESGFPTEYRPEIISGGSSRGDSTEPEESTDSYTRVSTTEPAKTAFNLIKYFNEEKIPYLLSEENEKGYQISAFVPSKHIDEFNKRLESLNVSPLISGMVDLLIAK